MMSDYIKRDAVIERTVKRNSIWNKVTNASGQGLEEIINEIPSADVAPVRHGRWELYSDGCSKYADGYSKECTGCRYINDCLGMNKRCSICKKPTPKIVDDYSVCGGFGADAHGGHLEYTFKQYEPMYCPSCGAIMDGENDE